MLEEFQKKKMECYILRYNLVVLPSSIGGTDQGLYLGWGMNKASVECGNMCTRTMYLCEMRFTKLSELFLSAVL